MASTGNPGNPVPGFDFLQAWMNSAGTALPGMSAWITPTLDPEELGKRIEDLRTVQFWLDQNSKLIGTSIQALEVQRMTLSTLKNLNLQVEDLGEALKIKTPNDATHGDQPPAGGNARTSKARDAQAPAPSAAGLVDPMQWWSALTQQFSELATQAAQGSGATPAVEATTKLRAQAPKSARNAKVRAATTPARTKATGQRRA